MVQDYGAPATSFPFWAVLGRFAHKKAEKGRIGQFWGEFVRI
jgi:hypothetical protein